MFIREKNLVLNVSNIEVVHQQGDVVEVVMVSGRTYNFSGSPRLMKKLIRAGRSRLFRCLCWILRR